MNHPVLTIASGNKTKVSEISAMLDVLSLSVQKQPEYLNVEETGDTYFENALLKAKAAALETKTWALADDSGLEAVSYTHLRAHETGRKLVCRLLLEKKKK